jgi:hypothetical protein
MTQWLEQFFAGRALGTAALALLGLIGCAHDKAKPPRDVPPALQVPSGQRLETMLRAIGVQIYQCTAAAQNPRRYGWVFQAPAADLADLSGKNVGWHHDGPTWESYDGSKVVGEVVAHVDAPLPSAVPWLLVRAKSNAGKGIFGKVQSVQRLHTVGGVTPQAACDAEHLGQITRVAYAADYYFYVGRR